MQGDALQLSKDSTRPLVHLRFASENFSSGAAVTLPVGFDVNDVSQALSATGWVEASADGLRMTTNHSCRYLAQVVSAMLDLFEQPGRPRGELIEAKSAVAEYYAFVESGVELAWFDYAWMNVMLREAIVAEAHSLTGIWSDEPTATIDIERLRVDLVETIIARNSGAMQETVAGKMAGSRSTRGAKMRDEKAG